MASIILQSSSAETGSTLVNEEDHLIPLTPHISHSNIHLSSRSLPPPRPFQGRTSLPPSRPFQGGGGPPRSCNLIMDRRIDDLRRSVKIIHSPLPSLPPALSPPSLPYPIASGIFTDAEKKKKCWWESAPIAPISPTRPLLVTPSEALFTISFPLKSSYTLFLSAEMDEVNEHVKATKHPLDSPVSPLLTALRTAAPSCPCTPLSSCFSHAP